MVRQIILLIMTFMKVLVKMEMKVMIIISCDNNHVFGRRWK